MHTSLMKSTPTFTGTVCVLPSNSPSLDFWSYPVQSKSFVTSCQTAMLMDQCQEEMHMFNPDNFLLMFLIYSLYLEHVQMDDEL